MSASIFKRPPLQSLIALARFYTVGVINTAFGYGIYSLFVFLGTGAYLAQLIGHVIGMAFNYMTYRTFAFQVRNEQPYMKFIGVYVFQYLLSLILLAAFLQIAPSEYLSGFMALIVSSLINFFVLKRWVFKLKS